MQAVSDCSFRKNKAASIKYLVEGMEDVCWCW